MSAFHRILPAHTVLLVVSLGFCLPGETAHAQESLSPGLSPSLSDPLSSSSSTTGFNSSFEPEATSITGSDLRTGISDPTNSQLSGSAISPLDNSYANASVSTAPRTGILTDAQAAVSARDPYFGNRYGQSFAPSGTSGQTASFTGRQAALGSFGATSMQSAFTGNTSSKAFAGTPSSSVGTSLEPPGTGGSLLTSQSGVGMTLLSSGSTAESANSFYATDPVLSGSTAGYEAGSQIAGDMPLPSAQTGGFFAEGSTSVPQFQYDDGQTPFSGFVAGTPGQIVGSAPDYMPSPFGFPDSTKGLAGLPSEASNQQSPFTSSLFSSGSPFAPVSEGTVYGLTLRFNPNLHAQPTPVPDSFEAFERRAQERRIIHGYSISQSSRMYQQDLRAYQRGQGRQQGSSRRQYSLHDQNGENGGHELISVPKVR
jgi:hypothetical protein